METVQIFVVMNSRGEWVSDSVREVAIDTYRYAIGLDTPYQVFTMKAEIKRPEESAKVENITVS